MKTFNETFLEFNKEYSIENLYLKRSFSEKSNKTIKWLGWIALITCLIGMLFLKFNSLKIGISLLVLTIAPLLVYFFIIQSYKARKELKSKKLPVPKTFPNNIFSYKSERLNDYRIKHIFQNMKDVKTETIIQNIQIASLLRNEPIKNPFDFFEKKLGYIGKTFLVFIIGIIAFGLKANFNSLNFKITVKLILAFLLIYLLFSFIWKFMFKSIYFNDIESKNTKLKDYIYVMQNILLLRTQ